MEKKLVSRIMAITLASLLTVQLAFFATISSGVVEAEELHGTVNLALPDDIEAGLNPYRSGSVSDRIMRGLLHSFLINMDEDLNPHRDLGSDLWTPSPDYMNWTIRIVENATWHDGTTVTAEDVVFTYDMFLGAYTWFPDPIRMSIESVEALDNYTILFRMRDTMWITPLYFGARYWIVPKHIWEKVNAPVNFQDAIGSGPFMFKERVAGSQIVLEAHEDYYRGSPKIQNINFKIIKNTSEALSALQNGEVDAVPFHNIPPSMIYEIKNNLDEYPNTKVVVGKSTSSMITLAFNLRLYPYNITDFRKAVAYAIDYDRIIQDTFLGFSSRVNPQLSHPFFPWYDPSIPMIERNLTRAREIFDEAGFVDSNGDGWREAPNGEHFTMKILSENSLLAMDLNNLIVSQLEDVGIRALADPKDEDTVHDIMREYRFDFDAALCTSTESYLLSLTDPTRYYFSFSSDREPSPWKNIAGFRNETSDLLSSALLYETNYTKVVEMTRECGRILAQELPQIGLAYGFHPQLYRDDRVGGWVVIEESAYVASDGVGVGINHLENWLNIYALPSAGFPLLWVVATAVAVVVVAVSATIALRKRFSRVSKT